MWMLAMVIGSAIAAITEPVDPNGFFDVFARGEQVLVAENSGLTSCTLSCPDASTCSSTSWSQSVPLSGGTGAYTLQATDPTGKYRLTCGTFTQDFFVRASHQRLWLDHNPPSALATDYVRDDPSYLSDSRRFEAPPNNMVASWDPLWVPDTGWDWVMNVRVPRYSINGSSTAIPPRAGSSATASLYPASILTSSDTGELKRYLNYVEDLGVTALTYDAYTTSYAASKQDTSYFEKSTHTPYFWPAFEYWGQQLVNHSAGQDWTTYSPWPNDDRDLIRAHLVLAMAVSYDWAYAKLSLAERRQWRKQLAEEVGELVTDYPAPSRYETFSGIAQANRTKKRLLSGHAFQIQAAVGAGTAVLYRELSSGAWSTDRDTWSAEAEDFYLDFLWAAGSDGAVHKGFLYFQTDLEMFLRYAEALRVSPEWTASTIDSTWYGTWARSAPGFLRHQTPFHGTLALTRQRPAFGDGSNDDANGPSYLLARIADQENLPSAQRDAWFGHNPRSFSTGATTTRRDTLDILWWDDSLVPQSDTSAAAAPTAQCHGDLGVVSLRSSWNAADSVHLVYRGGRSIGNHDYPDVGAFTLWRDGWLVTAAGSQPKSGRTATSAALLIDGQGQHHDGRDTNQQVPEVSTIWPADNRNNARLVGYFDNNSTSIGGQAIDVVTVATDLTQLYRYDSEDRRYVDTYTNVEAGGGPTLQSLRRYLVWVGGTAIFVADQWRTNGTSTNAYQFDWLLPSNEYVTDTSGDGIPDPRACAVTSSGGYFRYDAVGGTSTAWLRWTDRTASGTPGTAGYGIEYSSTDKPTREALNLSEYVPVISGTCPAVYMGLPGSSSTTIAPSGADRLDVKIVDAYSTALSVYHTPVSVGSTTLGHHLQSSQTRPKGMFLTRLRPYDASGSPVSSTIASSVAGGKKVYVFMSGYDVVAWFRDPASSSSTDSLNGEIVADVGVLTRNANTGTRYAVQMMNGTRFTYQADDLVSSNVPISLGFHWRYGGGITGWLERESVFSPTITLDTGSISAGSVTEVKVNGVIATHTSDTATNTITFTTAEEGPISVKTTSSGLPYKPRTSCLGQ